MNDIFGIVNRDGRTLLLETLERLVPESAKGGCADGHFLRDETAGFGLATDLSTHFRDPGGLLFIAAGRVNNRLELTRELSLGEEGASLGDRELIHRVWLRWGDSAPERIFGNWAFAVWNPAARRLFLARDHSGNSAIYYHANSRFFAFSSSRRALMKLDLPSVKMDELLLAQGLVSWNPPNVGRTIHRQIGRLLPAHFLTVTPERLEVRQYWRLEDTPQLSFRRRADYVPAFIDVFDRAVRDCLPDNGSVAAMLSGGLDSSSVAITAARGLLESGQRLTAFTSIPSFGTAAYTGSWFGDELPFARATAAAAGNIDLETVEAAGVSPVLAIRRALAILMEPKHGACNLFWLLELLRLVAAAGHRTLLAGNIGNGSISWTGDPFSQALPGQIRALGWRRWLRTTARRQAPQSALKAFRCYKREQDWQRETAINPDFARRLDLIDRYRSDTAEHIPQPALLRRLRLVSSGGSFPGSSEAEMAAAEGLEMHDPTADARVLAFCFSVPDEVYIDPRTGLDRWLIREAMKGRLPEAVRMNRRLGRQAGDLVPRLRKSATDVEQAIAEIEGGAAAEYVSIPALRAAWDRVRLEDSPEAFKLAVTVLTRGIMAALFVNGFGKY